MRPMVVCEIGINHMGKLAVAKVLIAMARAFGADFVKFQKRTIQKVYTRTSLNRAKLTTFGSIKLHQKLGLEFEKPEYDEIDKYCREIGIPWFGSAWDEDALDFLLEYKTPFLKVASACLSQWGLLEKMAKTGKPVILSCGMSRPQEIRKAVKILGKSLAFMLHCASEYPTSDESMNMAGMKTLRKMFGERFGYGVSIHNRRVIYIAQAAAMGAEMVEFHITLDKNWEGDDQLASLNPGEFLKAMEHLGAIERGWGNGKINPSDAELAKGNQYEWRR